MGKLSLSGTPPEGAVAVAVGSTPFREPNCTKQANAVSREATGSREAAVALASMSIIATERRFTHLNPNGPGQARAIERIAPVSMKTMNFLLSTIIYETSIIFLKYLSIL
jgi:hypothetical protein